MEFITRSRALEYFARFDIFAMTSWEDPCPRVVLENMGLGKPVVCFAGGGGAPEVVGDTGVIVPEFDSRAMAQAIADLAADPQEWARSAHRLGSECRQLHGPHSNTEDSARTEASCRSGLTSTDADFRGRDPGISRETRRFVRLSGSRSVFAEVEKPRRVSRTPGKQGVSWS